MQQELTGSRAHPLVPGREFPIVVSPKGGDRGLKVDPATARRDLEGLFALAVRTIGIDADLRISAADMDALGSALAEIVPYLRSEWVRACTFETLGFPPDAANDAASLYRSLRSEGVSQVVAWDGVWAVVIEGAPDRRGTGLVAAGFDGAISALRSVIALRGQEAEAPTPTEGDDHATGKAGRAARSRREQGDE